MLNRVNKILILIVVCSFHLTGQSIEFEHTIKVKFDNVPLENVLDAMAQMYDYKFSYVPEKMPLDHKVQWNPTDAPNTANVENFLSEQKIQFIKIGDQYVLRYEENQDHIVNVPEEVIFDEENLEEPQITPRSIYSITYINYTMPPEADKVNYRYDPPLPIEKDRTPPPLDEVSKSPLEMMNAEGAQVSLIPGLGTSKVDKEKVNKASLNIIYGYNGGVDGFEIGAGVNRIEHNVKGVQVAGLANYVGETVTGFQGSSFYNRTKDLHGVQLSGGLNIVTDTLDGMQISSFGNIHKGDEGGFQFASIFNSSSGKTTGQISSIYNKAASIDGLQLGLINNSGSVEGFQIGLINIADSVSGASIGLLNFVKNGYKHLEVYNTESMAGGLSYTFGSNKFYNRIVFGATKYDQEFTWGMGFGFGSNLKLSEKNSVNLDLQSMHISKQKFSVYVNLLNTFSINLTTKISDRISFFIGPSVNVYVKKFTNLTFDNEPVSQTFGPDLFPFYSKADNQTPIDQTLVKGWVGWKVGLRFF